MTVQHRVLPSKNPPLQRLWHRRGLWQAAFLLIAAATTAWAQPSLDPGSRIRIERPSLSPFETGSVMLAPVPIQGAGPRKRELSCKVICSPFEPRQSLAEIAWREESGPTALDPRKLRLDIVGAPSKFTDGNFGTVRIGAIPFVRTQAGAGIDVEAVRRQAQPVFIQQIANNRIVPRNPDLPAPVEMKMERLPRALPQLSQPAKNAMAQDWRTGGFGRMQVVAQSVEPRRSVPHRNLVVEGLQPGLTYKIRLVHERTAREADSVGEHICRVPVCPADFMEQP